jgi:flagellar basal-body rod protein FlgB
MSDFRLTGGLSDGLQRVLDLRREQHTLTAANLANANTPGYLAREIPFDELLGDTMAAAERGEAGPAPEARWMDAPSGRLDGNSVDAEREAVKMTVNSVMYNALSQGLSRHLSMLRYAASDGKS